MSLTASRISCSLDAEVGGGLGDVDDRAARAGTARARAGRRACRAPCSGLGALRAGAVRSCGCLRPRCAAATACEPLAHGVAQRRGREHAHLGTVGGEFVGEDRGIGVVQADDAGVLVGETARLPSRTSASLPRGDREVGGVARRRSSCRSASTRSWMPAAAPRTSTPRRLRRRRRCATAGTCGPRRVEVVAVQVPAALVQHDGERARPCACAVGCSPGLR